MSRKKTEQTPKKRFNILPYIAGLLVLIIIVLGSMFLYVYSKRNIARVVVDYPITERMIELEILNLQRYGLKAPTNATIAEQEETYANARKQAITNLTNFMVVLQHAKDTNATQPTKEEIEERMDFVAKRADMELHEYLAEGGITKSEFKTQVRNQLIFENITYPIMDKVPMPSEADLQNYFDINKQVYMVPENVDYRVIAVPDEETHNEVIKKLGEGAEFCDLVEEYSTDFESKKDCGLKKSVMKAAITDLEIANALFPPSENYTSIEIGQTRGVITQKSGIKIIKLEARHPEQRPDLHGAFKLWDMEKGEYVEVEVYAEVEAAWSAAQGQSNVSAFVRKLSDRYEPQIYDRIKGNIPWDGLEQFFGKLLGPALFNKMMGFSR